MTWDSALRTLVVAAVNGGSFPHITGTYLRGVQAVVVFGSFVDAVAWWAGHGLAG